MQTSFHGRSLNSPSPRRVMKQCPKCKVLIKNSTHFHRHVKRCGTAEHRAQCAFCSKSYSRNDDLKKHIKQKHPQVIPTSTPRFTCEQCSKTYCYEMAFNLHKEHCGKDKPKPFQCTFASCGKRFARKATLEQHLKEHAHPSQQGGGTKRKTEQEEGQQSKKQKLPNKVNGIPPVDEEVSAMKGAKVDAFFKPQTETQRKDQQVFFKETLPRLSAHLVNVLKEKKGIKWNLMYHCTLTMHDPYRHVLRRHEGYFRTPHPLISTYPQQLSEQLQMALETVEERMSLFAQAGSGWTLEDNNTLVLEMVDYHPIGGTSYIELPKDLYNTKSIVNVQNEDQACFKWSILAALHPASTNPQRVTYYQPFEEELNFNGIEFPMTIDQIPKFEKLNPNMSITILGYEKPEKKMGEEKETKSGLFPLRVPDKREEKHIVLLYWGNKDQYHYAWVKNLNRLLSHTKTHGQQTHFCERCFQGFTRPDLLNKHSEICCNIPIQAVQMVDEEISFKSWIKTEECLFRVYADFECLLQECQEGDQEKTIKVQKHGPCSVAWVLISDHPEVENRSFLYRPTPDQDMSLEETSADVIDQLMENLQELEEELLPYQREVKPMTLTEEQEAAFQAATHCYMCDDSFLEKKGKWSKVRDHNHATGAYRGAAHQACNLNKKRSTHIPVFFHNLRGYDGHLIMQGIHRYADEKSIRVIPNNMEKYVSFQLGNLRFLDSLQFLGPGSSLDKLAKNLTKFPHLKEEFEKVWSFEKPEDMDLLCKKGIYPYSYMKSFDVFEETSLPPQEAFRNDLTGDDIKQEDYDFAQQVWTTMNCQSMGEYHDLYLYQDIFLLADIFEQFRQVCLRHYELDPAHYYTIPGLAWDGALKYTQVKLVTLHDIEMHQFLEKGMRGGISMISHRYAKANNPYLSEHNPEQSTSYILYKDANNLYGHAMVQPLPISEFKWMPEKEVERFDVTSVAEDTETGYFLEVDLDYPPELHDLHNDYPLAPEKMLISHEMLSPHQQELKQDLQYKPAQVEKLLPNLWDKENYVIHYRNLKFYLAQGLKLKKIHRVLQFKQKAWLKPYIEFNTRLRAQATNAFEKEFFKLMNNSVFGKTMEDVRRRVDIKLIHDSSKFVKHASKVTYKRSVVFVNDEEKEDYFVGLEAQRTSVKLDKPIYTGFTVLELSKLHMYDYHYNHVMKKYGPHKAKLLFTDTDSLTYLIETKDVYQDMKEDQELYDFSDYESNHPLYSIVNKKVIGKFKDETAGVPVIEFVGLRAKMYSILTEVQKHDQKKGKGIKKSVLKKEIAHQDYKDCLFEKREYQHSMMGFRSHLHQVYTEKQTKKSLSPFDDKRFILEDGFTTRAHGHHLNQITRPGKGASQDGLVNALSGFTLSSVMSTSSNNTSPMNVISNNASPMNVMDIPPPPSPPVQPSAFHSFLTSGWE